MALIYHLLLILFVALQARPLHAAPLRAWGAAGGHGFRHSPAPQLDIGVEPLRHPGGVLLKRASPDPGLHLPLPAGWHGRDVTLQRTSPALPHPPAPQARGHRRGHPTGKYSGEGAKKSSEALETLQQILEELERGQDVATKQTGSADTPVTAASSTAQSLPVPWPENSLTGLPVGQGSAASQLASSTEATADGTDVPLVRTSPAPRQPGWHPGDVDQDISGNAETPWQELFNINLQYLEYLKAHFVIIVVAATFLLILVSVVCCTATCYFLKKAIGKGSADPGHQLETGSFLSSLEKSCPDITQGSDLEQLPEQALETSVVEHPTSPLQTVTAEHPRRSFEALPEEFPRRSLGSMPEEQPHSPQRSRASDSSSSTVLPSDSETKAFQQAERKWSYSSSSHRASQHSNSN